MDMSETERLREALDYLQREGLHTVKKWAPYVLVAHAARRWLAVAESAVPVRWCTTHGSQAHLPPQPEGDEPDELEGSEQDVCLHVMIVAEPSPCVISDAVIALSEVGNTSPLYPGEPE
jgi:hypothetical protein